jgi:hypothetical protein
MTELQLYEQVVLRRDIAADGLKAGDVATLVDIIPGPEGKSQGAVLEVFNALGHTICVISVSVDDVEPLQANEIFPVRRLAAA